MRVQYVNDALPRSDGKPGKPTDLTLFNEYEVIEVLEEQYTVLNDDYKLCRYSKSRFLVTDSSKVKPLREAFNRLTWPLRMEVKRLRQHVIEINHNTV